MEGLDELMKEVEEHIIKTRRMLQELKKEVAELNDSRLEREIEVENSITELRLEVELIEEGLKEGGFLKEKRTRKSKEREDSNAKKSREETIEEEEAAGKAEYIKEGRKISVTSMKERIGGYCFNKDEIMQKGNVARGKTKEEGGTEDRERVRERIRKDALLIATGRSWKGQGWVKYMSGFLGRKVDCTFELTQNDNKRWVVFKKKELKDKVWEKRSKIRSERVFTVDEYLTGWERVARYKLGEIAREKRRRGEVVKQENKKIWVQRVPEERGRWYRWDGSRLVEVEEEAASEGGRVGTQAQDLNNEEEEMVLT